jgi:hypothetical protein
MFLNRMTERLKDGRQADHDPSPARTNHTRHRNTDNTELRQTAYQADHQAGDLQSSRIQ